jgi:hypothetical protein
LATRAAAVIGDVLDVEPVGVGHVGDDDGVFLARAGAAHHILAIGRLHRLDIFLEGGDARILVHPEHERVDAHHRDGGEGLDVDAEALLAQRRGEEGVERHQDGVIGVARAVDMQKRLGARAAALVVRHQRTAGEVFLLGHRLDEAGDLIGAAAGAGHDHEIDRAARLPAIGERGQRHAGGDGGAGRSDKGAFGDAHHGPPCCYGPRASATAMRPSAATG